MLTDLKDSLSIQFLSNPAAFNHVT